MRSWVQIPRTNLNENFAAAMRRFLDGIISGLNE